MRVLLTNDDGIGAEGLHALRRALAELDGIETHVIVPDSNRSATARSITTRSPLSVEEVELDDGGIAYATDGTPVDCVRFGDLAWSISTTPWSARPSRTCGSWRAAAPKRRASCGRIYWRATSFRQFDRSTLALCEPLRAMRIVYMSGWIARRWEDPSFPHAFPLFRNHNYWNQEYEELVQIAEGLG